MNVAFIEHYSVDCKASAVKVLRQLGHGLHHFTYMEDLVNMGSRCTCTLHDADCVVDNSNIDMMVVGPPCSPYSGQRVGRFSEGCPFL